MSLLGNFYSDNSASAFAIFKFSQVRTDTGILQVNFACILTVLKSSRFFVVV